MTAEVAIVNGSAVALAADSAVTITGQKTYNSAIKLFSLSKFAPVGIMVYGNANLMDVPWETLIKTYRAQLGYKVFDSLQNYAEDFIRFLETHPSAFPPKIQSKWIEGNVTAYFTLMRDQLWERFRERRDIPLKEVLQTFREIVRSHHERLERRDFCDGMTQEDFDRIRANHKRLFHRIRQKVFEKLPIKSDVAKLLNDIGSFLHVKDVFSGAASGVVFAGFGEKQLFPSIFTYRIEGVVENKLKYKHEPRKSYSVTSGNECAIIAFAQEDMVATFMNGINPSIYNLLRSYVRDLFRRLPEIIRQVGCNSQIADRLTESGDKLFKSFFEELDTHIKKTHAAPVLRMVMALPKNELAEMAEAFVNLTAFKRKVTDSMETVGGPVDVAVISKGDGLVWVKRKHYFPPELNQHFFANYFKEVGHAKGRQS